MKHMLTTMKNHWLCPWISLVIRLILGIVFIYASLGKLRFPAEFADQVENYQVLPNWLVNPFSLALPSIELFAGIFIIVGFGVMESTFLIFCMSIMFIIALSYAILTGINTDCGCFHSPDSSHPVGWGLVFRDILMALGCLYIYYYHEAGKVKKFIFSRVLGRKEPVQADAPEK